MDSTPVTGHTRGLGRSRRLGGFALAGLGLAALTGVLLTARSSIPLASVVLLYLAVVVAVAALGGIWPALAAAVASDLLVNFFFVQPFHTLTVENRDHVIVLLVYVAVAITVALAVELAARQRAAAARTGIEAALLARISAEPIGIGSLADLLEHVRDTLGMDSAALAETDTTGIQIVAAAGPPPSGNPTLSIPAGAGCTLILDGPQLFAPNHRFLHQLGATAARAWQAERLAAQAVRAKELAEIDHVRAALLTAVGHDLRTPLAAIKAAASSMTDPQTVHSDSDRAELVDTIEQSTDRMADLVENLLAMSRLQAGALSVHRQPTAAHEIVAAALGHLPRTVLVDVDVPADLPLADADPGLLERIVANLLSNAIRHSPPGKPIRVQARCGNGRLHLAVIDHGPGIPAAQHHQMFTAFQHRGDYTSDGGLGLGLAIAHGFAQTMDATISPSETDGGGLTMTITLQQAP
jgi:two-component system sensor histidine kinase KdpD